MYEYRCPEGHRFEVKRPFKDSAKDARCPECDRKANRIMSVFAFTFGWMLDEQSHIKWHKDNWVKNV